MNYSEMLFNRDERLIQEIERLEEELDKTRLSELDKEYTIESNINSYNKLAKYSEELEDRIDKAIEYIENHIIATETEDILLDILKGEE